MCDVFLNITANWTIFALNPDGSTGNRVGRNRDRLEPGNYIVLGPGMCKGNQHILCP